VGCLECSFVEAGKNGIEPAGHVRRWRTVLSYNSFGGKQFVSLRGGEYMVASICARVSGGKLPPSFSEWLIFEFLC
jgi:hypothetical protein